METRSRWFDIIWILLWGILSSIWCLSAATQLSATFDEPFYLQEGVKSWRTGSNDRLMRAGTMPLPVDLQTLPIYLWEQSRGTPFDLEQDFHQLLPIARMGNLVFWWLLLIYAWRLANHLGGVWAGRLAVSLIASEPNLLAHATLATTDISVSACLVGFFYHYLIGRDSTWVKRIGIPALWYGFAINAKASAMVFGILGMVAVEFHRLWTTGSLFPSGKSTVREKIRHLWLESSSLRHDSIRIFGWGMLIVFLYCGTDWGTQKSFVKWANSLPDGIPKQVMSFTAENLRLFPNAAEGLVYQIKHNFRGHGVYLLGDWEKRAIWYYFPTTLALKLSIPILVLMLFLIVLKPRAFFSPVGVLAGLLFLFTFNCRVQIGVRLILPLIGFLLIAVSIAFVQAIPRKWSNRTREATIGIVVLLAMIPAVSVWPHGLTYFNQLAGGSSEGYRYLSDSNYDWGQGLLELRDWQAEHTEKPVKLWYFGADPMASQKPFQLLKVHQEPLQKPEDLDILVGDAYLAVGASIRYGDPEATPAWKQAIANLKTKEPIARTETFFIYDFSKRP
jgi:hypothetical protein